MNRFFSAALQFTSLVVLCSFALMFSVSAWAQTTEGASIAGVVRDTSGAVMPGVTVEAASPALIEKVRSVVTDERGLYRIVDLRPGTYTVTFTLPGFSTFRREGIELTTSFTATVNAEMKVGSVEDTMTGGPQVNIVSKDGGNRLSGSLNAAYAGPSLQMGNLTDALRNRGLKNDISIRRSYDYGGALGGPIKKDKLWFFMAHRWWGASRYVQGSYFNKLQHTLFYEPDLGRVSHNNEYFEDHSLRLTWQVSPKHKIVGSFSQQNNCSCPFGLTGVGGINAVKPAPESRAYHVYNPQYLPLVTWIYTASNKLVFEAGQSALILNEDSRRQPYVGPDDIRVTDLALNTVYGADGSNNVWSGSYTRRFVTKYNTRFSASYVTGSHNFKTGFTYQRYNLGR